MNYVFLMYVCIFINMYFSCMYQRHERHTWRTWALYKKPPWLLLLFPIMITLNPLSHRTSTKTMHSILSILVLLVRLMNSVRYSEGSFVRMFVGPKTNHNIYRFHFRNNRLSDYCIKCPDKRTLFHFRTNEPLEQLAVTVNITRACGGDRAID